MIEAVFNIGKIQKEQDFIEEFIEDIGSGYNHVFKIVVDITEIDNIKYLGIDYEEFDSSKKLKYFYKRGNANGPDKTPTSKITTIKKIFNNKIKNVFDKFLKDNKNILNESEKIFLNNLHNVVNKELNKIKEDFVSFVKKYNLLKNNDKLKENGILTFVFKNNDKTNYVGDIDVFRNTFKINENIAYKFYYQKFNTESRAKRKLCYICNNVAKEVWGFVNTYNFYTADKKGYVTGGFNQSLMWRNYPVCPKCAKVLERGKKYIDNNLNYKFCGFNYFIIPELVINNDILLKNILEKMKKYKNFSLEEKKAGIIERVEEKIIRELSEEKNSINFDFIFYKKSNSEFKILLFLQEIAPTRLRYLIKEKDKIDRQQRKYDIFKAIKTNKSEITFNFSFNIIREIFPNNKLDGNFDNYFLAIINDIFIGKKISMELILKRIMEKIRIKYFKDEWIDSLVLKAYKVLLYLEAIGILERRRSMIKNYENNYEEFFKENAIFDDDLKKALFLEGVLAKKLLNIQFQERNSMPFRSKLNGLKIDEKIVKKLLPEIINKLEEYGKNYYSELESIIGIYLLNADYSKYSVDEMSFYFTLGLVLEKYFKFNREENEKIK